MRAGDTVFHRPSGETWVLAPCGWPPCAVRLGECDLVRACSDAEHRAMLENWAAKSGDDFRADECRRQLFELNKGYLGAGI